MLDEILRLDPSRSSFGSDLYIVESYDPGFQTVDLRPASINQRGRLTQVPIFCSFGGAWENQQNHQPPLRSPDLTEQWGNAARGARWGMNFPVQPGDMARVEYHSGSMSDPVVTAFFRWRGDFSPAWLANQVFSEESDFTSETPESDDVVSDRFDLLLPSGGWVRCTSDSSWTLATGPVNRPAAWISLFADGKIKIKSRGDRLYTTHVELDPTTLTGRIAIGELDDASFIEFKDGDITLRAKKNIVLNASRVTGNVIPQGGSGALSCLTDSVGLSIPDSVLPNVCAQAGGFLSMLGGPGSAINLISDSSIEGNIRNRLQGLLLDGDRFLSDIQEEFSSLVDVQDIGNQLQRLVGAHDLLGSLPNRIQAIDFSALSLARELGIPSWIGEQLNQEIQTRSGVFELEAITADPPIRGDYPDETSYFSEVATYLGSRILLGANPENTENIVRVAFEDEAPNILANLVRTPTQNTRSNLLETAAVRLGRSLLAGNTDLGGRQQVFRQILDFLPEDSGRIVGIARQIEKYVTNPTGILGELPDIVQEYLPQLAQLPPELRDVISKLPTGNLGTIPEMALSLAENYFNQQFSGQAAALLQAMPEELRAIAGGLPTELFESLGRLPDSIRNGVLGSAQDLISDRLPDSLIGSLFGGASSRSGVFDVRVLRRHSFPPVPSPGRSLDAWTASTFHPGEPAPPIKRFEEFGRINLPDFFR